MTSSTAEFSYFEELDLLISVLPASLREAIKNVPLKDLIEIVLDLGRLPEARLIGGRFEELTHEAVTQEQLNQMVNSISAFSGDNRAGIPRTLHRISCLRNRQGEIIGLTCRVGKVITGTIEPIRDYMLSGKNVLLLGPPGVGKTTKLREISQLLAGEGNKRVMIVDTSNEIAGDGDIPHPAVGRARRIQVPTPERQQAVMIEAVENHTPQVIIVDEIGTNEEAQAARTIAERGVTLIATAHGIQLENLIKNPVLCDLIGGIQSVTLGDEEAKRRSSQKTILEREKQPTFDVAIELRDKNTVAIYPNVAEAIDSLLRGWTIFPEIRKIAEDGDLHILQPEVKMIQGELKSSPPSSPDDDGDLAEPKPLSSLDELHTGEGPIAGRTFKVFLYSLTKGFVDQIIQRLDLGRTFSLTASMHDADAVLALRGQARPGSRVLKFAMDYEVPIVYAKTNTMAEVQRALREAFMASPLCQEESFLERLSDKANQWLEAKPAGSSTGQYSEDIEQALEEVRQAIEEVLSSGRVVELSPRRSYIRRLQHELAERHRLRSLSVGDEPNRRLKLLPPSA